MSPSHVKIPEGLYKRIFRLGKRRMLLDIVLWYRLKAYNSDGFIARGSVLRVASNLSRGSVNTIHGRIKRLISYGLIVEVTSGIMLVKYDTLFQLFEYDLSDNYRKKGFRKGKFKIWKLPVEYIEDILDFMMYYDVHQSITKQKYREISKLKRRGCNVNKFGAEKNLEKMVAGRITLSCRGTAEMFGYKDKSTGHKILSKLKKMNVIKTWGRYRLVSTSPRESEKVYSKLNKSGNSGKYRMMNGLLYEILANGIESVEFIN